MNALIAHEEGMLVGKQGIRSSCAGGISPRIDTWWMKGDGYGSKAAFRTLLLQATRTIRGRRIVFPSVIADAALTPSRIDLYNR